MPHEAMDIETVADLLDVSTRQIRTYMTAGMPFDRDGRKPVFVWKHVLKWYVGYASALEYGEAPLARATDERTDETSDDFPEAKQDPLRAATLRKTRADADLRELALSRERGQVISIADAGTRLNRMLGNLRAQLLGLAPKLATRLAGISDPTSQEPVIKDEMEVLCRELSSGAILGTVPTGDNSSTVVDLSAAADTGLSRRKLQRMADRLLEDYRDPL